MTKRIFSCMLAVVLAVAMMVLGMTVVSADGTPSEALIESTTYSTLKEAVNAANEIEGGATVTLIDNVTLSEKLTITGNVTISGEHTITRAGDYTGTLFAVDAGATLTLDGGLVIDGANEWIFDEDGYKAALENKSKHQEFAFVTSAEGAPVATADMFTLNGAVVVNKATIQNHMGNSSCNVFGANANSSLTLNNGAVIKHNATPFESTVIAMSAGSTFTINEGAEISGNYAGRNGGISRNNNGTIVMNGGKIINNYSVNTNGTVFMLYGADSMFEMNDGLICENTGTNGPNNGRNAAIYGHTGSKMVMKGGEICHNTGISYGGVDAPYTGSTGNASSFEIRGGYIGENISVLGNATADVNGGSRLTITGGTFTQDISQWCDTDYVAKSIGDGTWTVIDSNDAEWQIRLFYYDDMNTIRYVYTGHNKTVELPTPTRRGYNFFGWFIDAECTEPWDDSTLINKDWELHAAWEEEPTPTSFNIFLMLMLKRTFPITTEVTEGGAITFDGDFKTTDEGYAKVRFKQDITYTITPDEGYMISDVLVDGKSVGAVSEYTFENVGKKHTIYAIFAKIESEESDN